MNSITKLIADLRQQASNLDGLSVLSYDPDFKRGAEWATVENFNRAADMVEREFFGLLEKVRAAESEIVEVDLFAQEPEPVVECEVDLFDEEEAA